MDSVEILMSVSAMEWHGVRMTTTGGTGRGAVGATWASEAIVTACVIVALLPMGFLHVSGIGVVDPLFGVISDYVFRPGGYALMGAAAISLAVAAAVLAIGLRRAELPGSATPVVLFVSAAVALVLVAVFPTHAPGTTPGLVSTVHRAAGGWVFAVVPLATWMVARRARSASEWRAAAPALHWVSGTAAVLSAIFLLSHVPIVIAGSPGFPAMGGLQRVVFVMVMLVLVATARATRLAVEAVPCPEAVPAGAPLRGAA
jgi:hypothetical protein